jgi:flavin-dependent dehydrogenase
MRFLGSLGRSGDGYHGGFLPWRLREPTVGPLFVVGDAAGQCLPVTGEGIRPSLYFGAACGRVVQRVIDGELTLEEGLSHYRRVALAHRGVYRALEAVQRGVLAVPHRWTEGPRSRLAHVLSRFWSAYAGRRRARGSRS